MNFLKTLFKSFKRRHTALRGAPADPSASANVATEAVTQASTEGDAADEAARRATSDCLDRHWQSVGVVEQDVLGHVISPSFLGGPDWPSTRQAYRIVRRGDSVIIATDGLSDPFDSAPELGNGFEMELFLETGDLAEGTRGAVGDVSPLMRSWAFDVVRTVASTVANAGGIRHQLETTGCCHWSCPVPARRLTSPIRYPRDSSPRTIAWVCWSAARRRISRHVWKGCRFRRLPWCPWC